ncbi:RDD family protein [Aliiglaciecola sp. CAU 1673]|uniref:RDD family protein n=1 Tax=Aliiglaciecola sp. CAU 1673 TaxID=3032595 RepID=UPI0023DB0821|nr:RDD family protein [Aliiglaciecola sp. CAU 1673]MDF2177218.1 RDD family protein [Aliiglaciecola sp. CAU 1673]
MSQPHTADHAFTAEETRAFVTPYAFGVAPDLLGTPLATPLKRGLAILVDLLAIAMLTEVNSLFLAALSAWAFMRAQQRMRKSGRFQWGRRILRGLAALMIFILALGLFEAIRPDNPYYQAGDGYTMDEDKVVTGVEGIKVLGYTAKHISRITQTAKQIEDGKCPEPLQCWSASADELADDLVDLSLSSNQAHELMKGFAEETTGLTETQQQQLLTQMQERYEAGRATMATPVVEESSVNSDIESTETVVETDKPAPAAKDESSLPFSVVAWAKSIAADLGIGVGWAAFYFTVFTAWWQGQTPGKRMFGIKVIKLDGNPLNLWESFGRYGGYGAGIATGLMGFMQVYWDANRQAVQDKISETLVIDTRKPKLVLSHQQVEILSHQAEEEQKAMNG